MAAHETSGVLRAHRAGASGPALAYILGCSMRSLKHEFKLGLDLETEAALQGDADIRFRPTQNCEVT
jgi:hypothetical protein